MAQELEIFTLTSVTESCKTETILPKKLIRETTKNQGISMRYRPFLSIGALAATAAFFSMPTADAQVFWTANGAAEIRSANLDGSNPGTIIDRTGLFNGNIVGVAATSSHVYWTVNTDNVTEPSGAGIWRANHNGSNPTLIVPTANTGNQFLAIDESAGRLYFSDWTEGLFWAPLSGGAVNPISNPAASNTGIVVAGPNQLLSIAAGGGDRNIYSTDIIEGTSASLTNPYAAASNQSYGLVISDANIAYTTTFNNGNLSSYNLGTDDTVQILPNGSIGQALGMALTLDQSGLLIVGRTTGNIFHYDIAGESLTTFIDGAGAHFGIAVVPEPSAYALIFGLAAGALLIVRRRFRK